MYGEIFPGDGYKVKVTERDVAEPDRHEQEQDYKSPEFDALYHPV